MNPILLAILVNFDIFPIEAITFPTEYRLHDGPALKYSATYSFSDDRHLQAVEGRSGIKSEVTLDSDHFIEKIRQWDGSGNPLPDISYVKREGRPAEIRQGDRVESFFYRAGNLDSAAVAVNDSLKRFYRYGYDSQNRPIWIEHHQDLSGQGPAYMTYETIAYHLPDSVVLTTSNGRGKERTGWHTFHLMNGRLVKMVGIVLVGDSEEIDALHTWKYAESDPVRKPEPFRASRKPLLADRFGGGDLLGRNLIRLRGTAGETPPGSGSGKVFFK